MATLRREDILAVYEAGPEAVVKLIRKISDRLVGGQEGYPGHTLKMVNNPDHIVTHRVSRCNKCGSSLEEIRKLSLRGAFCSGTCIPCKCPTSWYSQ